MTDSIYFDGVEHISATDAARETDLSRDYIGRLCREGRVAGRRVGKQWYVAHASLKNFLIEQEYQKAARREGLAQERAREYVARSAAEEQARTTSARVAGSVSLPSIQARLHDALSSAEIANISIPGASDAALTSAHVPAHVIAAAVDAAHKVLALTLVVALTFGTYSLVDPSYVKTSLVALGKTAIHAEAVSPISSKGVMLAAAAASPTTFEQAAMTFSDRIDSFVYAIAFPPIRTFSSAIAGRGSDAAVTVRIVPYVPQPAAAPVAAAVKPAVKAVPAPIQTIINQPVVEHVVTTERVLTEGGISEAMLTERLQELDNKLSVQMFSLAHANSTVSQQNYDAIALTNRVDQLVGTAIKNATITGGSISGASISASSFSATDGSVDSFSATNATTTNLVVTGTLTAPALSFTGLALTNSTTTNATTTNLYAQSLSLGSPLAVRYGGTGTSTAPTYGKVLVGNSAGGYDLLATSSLGISGGAGNPGGSAGQVQFNDYGTFNGNSNFIVSTTTGEMTITGGLFSRATITAATSTSVFSAIARFTTAVADTFSSTLATITGLTATNATTTNATSTNLYATSFSASTASTTNLRAGSATIGTFTGPLQAVGGAVSASSTISIAYGGTGTSTAPTYGKVLVGNSAGGYDLLATSSLGITGGGGGTWGSITGTLSNQTDLQNALNAKFDLSAWYATTTTALAEGSNLYFTSARATSNFVSSLAATTSVASITTLPNLSLPSSQVTGLFGYLFPNNATTTGLGIYASTTIGNGTRAGGLTINGGATTTGNVAFTGLGVAGLLYANGSGAVSAVSTSTWSFASSSLLADSNTFTGANVFHGLLSIGSTTVSDGIASLQVSASGGSSLGWNGYQLFLGGNSFLTMAGANPYIESLDQNGLLQLRASGVNGGISFTTDSIERFRVAGSGNVGVGTSSPFAKFAVAGAAFIGGNLTATGTVSLTGLGSGFVGASNGTLYTFASSSVTAASSSLLADSNTFTGTDTFTNPISGSVTGNAGTVTNGVYTTTFNGLFDPRFVTDLAATTSVASITTLPNLSITNSQVSNFSTGVNSYINSSTTIPKTYTANTFTALQTFGNASSTLFSSSYASSTNAFFGNLSIANLTGLLKASSGAVTTASAGTDYLAPSSLSATFPLSYNSGTGAFTWNGLSTSSAAVTGNIPYFSGPNTFANVATTSFAAANTTLTVTGTLGALIGGANSTIALNLGNANTWTALQTFANATTTLLSATYASSTNAFFGVLNIPSITSTLLKTDNTGKVVAAVAGTDYSNFAYLFPNNATTTGLGIYASTTIGNGAQATGLTVSGGATTTGSAYVAGALSLGTALNPLYGGTGLSSFTTGDVIYADATNHLARLAAGGAGTVLKIAGGVPTWGTDLTSGGGGGAGAWATTTDSLAVYPTNTSNVIIVGTNATATANSIFEVSGKSYFSSTVGIATTAPGTLLSIGGVANFAPSGSTIYSAVTLGALTATSSLSVTGNTTLANATSSAIFGTTVSGSSAAFGATGTTTISSTGALVAPSLTVSNLTGPLQANNGLVSATSTLSVSYGGTGISTGPSYGQILVGNASGGYALTATSSLGLPTFGYPFPSAATSTLLSFNGGLTFTSATGTSLFANLNLSNALAVGQTATTTITSSGFIGVGTSSPAAALAIQVSTTTAGNFNNTLFLLSSSTASFATSTLFSVSNTGSTTLYQIPSSILKTNANGTIVAAVAGTDYQPAGTYLTALGSGYASTTNSAIAFSTTTQSFNGLTIAQNITATNGALTFAPNITGTLNNSGLTNSTISGVALGGTLNSLSHNASLSGTSYNGSAAISDWGLNLGNANTWTALQTFGNASSTLFSSSYASSTNAFFGNLSIANLTGLLKASSGAVTTASAGTDYLAPSSLSATFPLSYNSGTGAFTWNGLSTSSAAVTGNIPYFSGPNTFANVATTSFAAANTTLTVTGTLGALIGGANSTIALNLGNANTWTALQTFANATTTLLSATYASSTNLFAGTLGIGTTSPFAALSIFAGGTYASQAPATLFAIGSTTAGTATTTLFSINSSGLATYSTLTGGAATTTNLAITNIASSLLKTNGSGSVIPAIAGTDYLTPGTGVTSVAQSSGTAQNGAITLATTSSTTNGITSALSITNSGGTFTFAPSQSGTLTAGGGGTGINNPSAAGILLGSYAGGSYQQLATSSLGLLTTNVAEGSNLYYTDTRVNSYISSSTTIPKTYTANTFTALQTFGNASSTLFSSSYASSTNLVAGTANISSLTLGALSGFLKATAGAVSTSLISLTSDITGILGVSNGGTGWSTIAAGTLLTGNGAGALATTTIGTGLQLTGGTLSNTGVLSLQQTYGSAQTGALTLATSSAATSNGVTVGSTITNAGGTFTFAPTVSVANIPNAALQNSTISGVALGSNLNNITFNNGGSGAASGSTYNGGSTLTVSYNTIGAQPAGTYLTALGSGYASTTNSAIALSTTTQSFNGLTIAQNITATNGALTFAPNITGTLNNSGLTNSTISGVALGGTLNSLSHNASLSGTSYNGSAAISDWGLNLGNANTWTALQTFANATTTLLSATYASSTNLFAGTLGIGTTSPFAALSIFAGGTYASQAPATLFAIGSTTAGTATTTLFSINSSGLATYSTLQGGAATTSNLAITNIASSLLKTNGSGSVIPAIAGTDYANFAYPFPSAATTTGLGLYASTTIGAGGQATGLTVSGGATTTGRAYFSNNVGIGTNLPGLVAGAGQYLTISTTTNLQFSALELAGTSNVSNSALGRIDFFNNNGNSVNARIESGFPLNTAKGYIAFSTNDGSGQTTLHEQMRIFDTGNVGIGTGSTAPGAKLEVNGTASSSGLVISTLSGLLKANGTSAVTAAVAGTDYLAPSSLSATFPLAYNSGSGAFTFNGLSTSSAAVTGNIPYFSGPNTFANVATTSFAAANSTLTVTGTLGALIGGANSTIALNLGNANTWTALQTFANATTTLLSATYASSTNAFFGVLNIPSITSTLLKTDNTGKVVAAVAGTDYSNFGYLFPNNATTTGLGIYASTTIGNGAQATGLTVSGGATTTGKAYFAGNVGIGTAPDANLGLSIQTNVSGWPPLQIRNLNSGGNSWLYSIDDTGNKAGFVGMGNSISNFTAFAGNMNLIAQNANLGIGYYDGGSIFRYNQFFNSALGTIGMGTTTMGQYGLTIASSTIPQLALSAGAGLAQWAFRNAGGNFYLSTTTVDGTATTSTAAFSIAGSGFGTTTVTGLSINGQATSTSNVGFNITTGCFAINGTCVGGSGSGITALGSGYASTTNLAVTFSTSTLAFNGLTFGQTIVPTAGALTFTPTLSGTLGYAGGGTGTTTAPIGQLLYGGSTAYQSVATTTLSLGLGLSNTGTLGALVGGTAATLNIATSSLFTGSTGQVPYFTGTNALAGTSTMFLSSAGFLGLGTTTPIWTLNPFSSTAPQLALSAGAGLAQWAFRNAGGNFYLSTTTVAGTATTSSPAFSIIGASGNVGIGTTSPYATLSVAGSAAAQYFNADNASATSTFAGGFSANSGGIVSDFSSGVTSINNLAIGSLNFSSDAGVVTLADMPVTAASSYGTVEGYSQRIDGNALFTLYSEADGAGGIQNQRIGFGTTTPWAKLSLDSSNASTSPLFVISSSTATSLILTSGGRLGLGTTSPSATFAFAGTTGIFASTTATSTFQGGGINIVTAAGNTGCFAINGTCVGGGSGSGTVSSGTQGQFAFYNANGTTVSGTSTLFVSQAQLIGAGTSTPQWLLNPFSSTAPQLALSAGAGLAQWAFRNAGGNFYLSTTTVDGTATSSLPALTIYGAGAAMGLGTTSLPFAGFAMDSLDTSATYFTIANGSTGGREFLIGSTGSANGQGAGKFVVFDLTANANRFTIDGSGNAGFGTTSPGSLLSIGGNGTGWNFFNSGTTTSYAKGIDLKNGGCFAINGSCIGNGSFSNNLASGGTATTTFYSGGVVFSDGTKLTQAAGSGNSILNWDNTNARLGIGTSTPWAALSINPNGITGPAFAIGSSTATSFVVSNGGYVGIGTTSPAQLLDIAGSSAPAIKVTGTDAGHTSSATVFVQDGTGGGFFRAYGQSFLVSSLAGQVGFGADTTVGSNGIVIFGNSTATNGGSGTISLRAGGYDTAAQNLLLDKNGSYFTSGNVGVGTSTPWAQLSIFAGGDYAAHAASTLFAVGSTTAGTATTTFFSISSSGIFNYGVNATSTIPNNTPYAWTIATSSTATPLFKIDTTTGSASVGIGQSGTDVVVGDVGQPANLVFEESSTIKGQGSGRTITIGANSDVVNFGVNTGIASTSPWGMLSINPNGITGPEFVIGTTSSTDFIVDNGGNVGIATTSPTQLLDVAGVGVFGLGVGRAYLGATVPGAQKGVGIYYDNTNDGTQIQSIFQGNSFKKLLLNAAGGNVGIGTTSPPSTFTVQGAVTGATSSALTTFVASFVNTANSTTGNGIAIMGGSTSGTGGASLIQFYTPAGVSLGGVRQTNGTTINYGTGSDRRIKENFATSTIGINDLMKIPVLDFDYIQDPSHQRITGFVAQDLENIFPDAVSTNGDNGLVPLAATATPWNVDYGRVTPLIVKAVQDVAAITGVFRDNLIAWLGNAGNGIDKLFAKEIHAQNVYADETHTKTLCIADDSGAETCITKTQLDALIAGAAAGTAAANAPAAPATTTATLTINGNNPTQWNLNTAWQDNLGALFTHGGYSETVYSTTTIDTSVVGTTTVDYWATYYQDPAVPSSAVYLHATRAVVVSDPNAHRDTQAPVITLNGANPATVNVGSTYTDAGASVSDNVDQNLSFSVSLDGGATTTLDKLVVDTSTTTTHTIIFSATDAAGNTGTITRTVNVVQP